MSCFILSFLEILRSLITFNEVSRKSKIVAYTAESVGLYQGPINHHKSHQEESKIFYWITAPRKTDDIYEWINSRKPILIGKMHYISPRPHPRNPQAVSATFCYLPNYYVYLFFQYSSCPFHSTVHFFFLTWPKT